ncbi:MAG TPA: ABC transporter ATP-binding protein [Pyrinomonadaceae bacterium]|jgi:iron complex transport system ATP-binding protein
MLEAKEISIGYGAREVLAGISLSAPPGSVTAIIGPNGAGKSTLMRALNGAKETTRGEIQLDGKPLRQFARRVIGRRIAVVAQESELRFPVTVMEFVLGGRYAWASAGAWGWETERDIEAAKLALNETGLTDFGARLVSELSGGERQRAVLARALATEAPILLLDEPTANLDLAHQAAMLALVRERCDEREAAAVVVTHDVNLAAEFADRVLLLKKGRTLATGNPRQVLTPELLRELFDIQVLVDDHPITGSPRITPVLQHKRR